MTLYNQDPQGGQSVMRVSRYILPLLLFLLSMSELYAGEGTRQIVGDNVNVYFMNDKVFGTAFGNPLWADYRCGTDIKGEIDIKGPQFTP